MSKEAELNKEEIYTLIGRYKDNQFIDIDGNKYNLLTYRINSERMENGKLCAVNIKYIGFFVEEWVIFQYALLE